jgi:hypothetical protein
MKNQPEIDALFARFQKLSMSQKCDIVPRLFGVLDAVPADKAGADLLRSLSEAISRVETDTPR